MRSLYEREHPPCHGSGAEAFRYFPTHQREKVLTSGIGVRPRYPFGKPGAPDGGIIVPFRKPSGLPMVYNVALSTMVEGYGDAAVGLTLDEGAREGLEIRR